MSDAVASPGRKKHVRKADPEVDPEFQIAPMIDILLVLLVFFMSITSTEVLQSNQAIELPVAKEAKDSKPSPGQVVINLLYNPVNDASVIEVNEQNFTPEQLAGILQSKVAANPLMRVLIRADKRIKWEFERQLLQSVGKSGVTKVTFSVVDKDKQ